MCFVHEMCFVQVNKA